MLSATTAQAPRRYPAQLHRRVPRALVALRQSRGHQARRGRLVNSRAVADGNKSAVPENVGSIEELSIPSRVSLKAADDQPPAQLQNGTYFGFAENGSRIDLRVDIFDERGAFHNRKHLNIISLDYYTSEGYGTTFKNDGNSEFLNVTRGSIEGWIRQFVLTGDGDGIQWFVWWRISFDTRTMVLKFRDREDRGYDFRMQYSSPYYRKLDLEIDRGQYDQAAPEIISEFAPQMVKYFQKAGVDLRINEGRSVSNVVSANDDKWDIGELNGALDVSFDNAVVRDREWSMYGLIVPHFWGPDNNNVPGVRRYRGIMFDTRSAPYRQGWAVFSNIVLPSGWPPQDQQWRSLLRTLMHEAGHALNLGHSFRKGRPDALSWMHYDWKYQWTNPNRDPNAAEAQENQRKYWRDFTAAGWDFDRSELEVIRHGDLDWVAPGRNNFDGDGPHFHVHPDHAVHDHEDE